MIRGVIDWGVKEWRGSGTKEGENEVEDDMSGG